MEKVKMAGMWIASISKNAVRSGLRLKVRQPESITLPSCRIFNESNTIQKAEIQPEIQNIGERSIMLKKQKVIKANPRTGGVYESPPDPQRSR